MLTNTLRSVSRCCSSQTTSLLRSSQVVKLEVVKLNTASQVDPAVRDLPVQYGEKRQVWVESLVTTGEQRKGILDLHPEVFSVYPRLDIIHENLQWQSKYNLVNYNHVKNTHEMIYQYGGGRKPWPQKGTGRARHGNRRAPQWKNGGKAHGPRGPNPLYYMLPYALRVYGLTHTLSVKVAQDDLHVVEDLDIPTTDPTFLLDLVRERGWAKSCLIVDTEDLFPSNITAATEDIAHINLMPMYGLNVNSMVKHETLVLTSRAVEALTDRLMYALNRTDGAERSKLSSQGPKQLELKMEKYRPVV